MNVNVEYSLLLRICQYSNRSFFDTAFTANMTLLSEYDQDYGHIYGKSYNKNDARMLRRQIQILLRHMWPGHTPSTRLNSFRRLSLDILPIEHKMFKHIPVSERGGVT